MDKYAAEKLAEEYYQLGVLLSMEKLGSYGTFLAEELAEVVIRDMAKSGRKAKPLGFIKKLFGKTPSSLLNQSQRSKYIGIFSPSNLNKQFRRDAMRARSLPSQVALPGYIGSGGNIHRYSLRNLAKNKHLL